MNVTGPPEAVLHEIEEFLPGDAEEIGEEVPAQRDASDDKHDNLDAVSNSSLDNDVSSLGTASTVPLCFAPYPKHGCFLVKIVKRAVLIPDIFYIV